MKAFRHLAQAPQRARVEPKSARAPIAKPLGLSRGSQAGVGARGADVTKPGSPDPTASAVKIPVWAAAYLMAVFMFVAFNGDYSIRWRVYLAATAAVALLVLLGFIIGRAWDIMVLVFVVTLSLNVTYWLTEPLSGSYFGNSGPTGIQVPLQVLVAVSVVAFQVLFRGEKILWGGRVGAAGVVMLILAAMSASISNVRTYGLYALTEYLWFYVIFFATTNILRTKRDLRIAISGLLLVLALQAMAASVQAGLGYSVAPVGYQFIYDNSAFVRPTGTVSPTPSGFATFMEPLIFIALSLFFVPKQERGLGRWSGLLMLAGLVAVGFTQNRSSWSGIPAGFLIWQFMRRRYEPPGRKPSLAWLVGGVLLLVAFVAAAPYLNPRMAGEQETSFDQRFALLRPALEMAADHPVLGVGPGAYSYNVLQYLGGFRGQWLYFVHNEFLLMLAERGVLGLLAWCAWFLLGMSEAKRVSLTAPQPFRAIGLGCRVAFLVLLWELCWNSYEPFCATAIIWFLFAFLAATNRIFATETAGAKASAVGGARPLIFARGVAPAFTR